MLLFKKQGPNVAREYDYCLRQAYQALIDKGEDPAWWDIKQRVKHGARRHPHLSMPRGAARQARPQLEPLGEVFVYKSKTGQTIPVPPAVSPTRGSPEPAAEAARAAAEADRAIRARRTIHSSSAEKCDPVTDAQLAASGRPGRRFGWPDQGGGEPDWYRPLRRRWSGAESIWLRLGGGSGEVTLAAANDALEAYVAELRALTLARHSAYWVHLVQAFRLSEAVDEETAAYLLQFALNLENRLCADVDRPYRANRADDEALKLWTMALSPTAASGPERSRAWRCRRRRCQKRCGKDRRASSRRSAIHRLISAGP